MDFGCKKYTMLIAIAIAVAVVALAVVGVLTVATGGAALIALRALAGAVGAVVGSVVGGMLCGQKMVSKRVWIPVPKKNKTLFQGQLQVTGDWTMTCPIGGQITYAPNIKSWGQAIALASAGYITDVLEGMSKGALVGLGGAAIAGVGSLGAMFSGSGSAIAGNIGRATLQGLGRIGTNLAEGFFLDVGSKSVEASANVLQNYGESGEWNVVNDFASGYKESTLEDLNALNNIRQSGGNSGDWEAAIMLLAPGSGGKRDASNHADGNHNNGGDGTSHENSNSESNNSENTNIESENNTENESNVKSNTPNNNNNKPTSDTGEAFEDTYKDPPGTRRNAAGRLIDEKTGRYVVDPIVGRRRATDFYKKHGMTDRQMRSHLNGIDFTKPVTVVPIRQGTSLTQYIRHNTNGYPIRGDYYSDNPNATPNELGVSNDYNVPDAERNFTQEVRNRTKETVDIVKDVEGLQSTSAEIIDDWSRVDIDGNPIKIPTEGGGSQIYIPKTQF